MTLTNGLVSAAVGLSWLALTGAGGYVAHNLPSHNEVMDTNRPQMVREFWTWEMQEFKNPHVQMENLLTNLSEDDQEAVQSLLDEYREAEKAYHEAVDEATASIKEDWESTKEAIKQKIVAITWESEEVEALFSRGDWKWPKGWMWMMPRMDGERPEFGSGELPEMPTLEDGELPEMPEFNWERPELPNFGNGEMPNFENWEMSEMNGERPQMPPRGQMRGNPQGQQVAQSDSVE